MIPNTQLQSHTLKEGRLHKMFAGAMGPPAGHSHSRPPPPQLSFDNAYNFGGSSASHVMSGQPVMPQVDSPILSFYA